jgi:ABC-type spermidine/putrescine transport system permease subunit II
MHLRRLHEQVLVTYILQMFNDSTKSGLVWQVPHLHSISAHTLLNKLKVNAVTTSLILAVYSAKVAANSGTYTASFIYSERKKQGEYGQNPFL